MYIGILTLTILLRIENTHSHGINHMLYFPASLALAEDTQHEDVTRRKNQQARFLATGDDDDIVRLWDTKLCHLGSAKLARSKKLPLLPLGCFSH
mmetsp:Transcript_22456/g.22771  ORF Transcript_22456/g.22771 Transcript_22456/m.22771 type:complete len:95 (-) Transcript_22456:455-739(-)